MNDPPFLLNWQLCPFPIVNFIVVVTPDSVSVADVIAHDIVLQLPLGQFVPTVRPGVNPAPPNGAPAFNPKKNPFPDAETSVSPKIRLVKILPIRPIYEGAIVNPRQDVDGCSSGAQYHSTLPPSRDVAKPPREIESYTRSGRY